MIICIICIYRLIWIQNINECIYKNDKRFIELVKDEEIVKLWDSIKDKYSFL